MHLRRSINPTVDADGRLWYGAQQDADADLVRFGYLLFWEVFGGSTRQADGSNPFDFLFRLIDFFSLRMS